LDDEVNQTNEQKLSSLFYHSAKHGATPLFVFDQIWGSLQIEIFPIRNNTIDRSRKTALSTTLQSYHRE